MSGSDYRTGREGEFTYRGYDLDELQDMSLEEVAELLPARMRRSILRGLTVEQEKLLEKARNTTAQESANSPIRTHLRDMPVLPSFVEKTFAVYNGSDFERVRIEPEMLGHYLGEFQLTRTSVEHGQAGIGATRSSKFVPLK
ncbi:30S ribosomal protein S19P [Haladaptatus paucihalophilus DX253]|uniref:Small ribosomal subunit protein uS19 n=1 Tax=Haladaptatus paucihalophilus DX253 TaxID=797209 RepID=E7QZV2_HALPU|nr:MULTISPECIES: 30S ribosomal protein S19 [Haladaptatus]EFW89846.1 30S ribosomal protein S19P [Haladaptatus paucihalophilus DX253]ODR79424.1 30S ribosomal protein S19 [Haladaptatus sp. W1]GKZ12862.1 30S ribosomal protein S19 [Haladaptatus sp. T7]SHK55971.1 small subunit ribosomal protein S19 [Haladaptatus paucihalophilus DX253]